MKKTTTMVIQPQLGSLQVNLRKVKMAINDIDLTDSSDTSEVDVIMLVCLCPPFHF